MDIMRKEMEDNETNKNKEKVELNNSQLEIIIKNNISQ